MGRTGSTVPAVHTSPRKFRTCNGLEVLHFYDSGIVRTCTEDLYRVPGPPIYEYWWTGDWWSFEELPHPWPFPKVMRFTFRGRWAPPSGRSTPAARSAGTSWQSSAASSCTPQRPNGSEKCRIWNFDHEEAKVQLSRMILIHTYITRQTQTEVNEAKQK